MFLEETSDVFGRNTVCFYLKNRMFLCRFRFFNIDFSFLSKENLNVFCRLKLKDFFRKKNDFRQKQAILKVIISGLARKMRQTFSLRRKNKIKLFAEKRMTFQVKTKIDS